MDYTLIRLEQVGFLRGMPCVISTRPLLKAIFVWHLREVYESVTDLRVLARTHVE